MYPAEVNCSRGRCWRTFHLLNSSKEMRVCRYAFQKTWWS